MIRETPTQRDSPVEETPTEGHRSAPPAHFTHPAKEPERLKRALESGVGVMFVGGHRVEVLRNGDEIFPAMLDAVRNAEKSIDFLTFIYWQGEIAKEFASALAERSRGGVRVRVLLDAFGSGPMDQSLVDEMVGGGVAVERFRPTMRFKLWESDHRTHRKVMVVDNRIGFTGGVGIAQEWTGDARNPDEWRDTHFRLEGPGVLGLKAAFLTDWRDTGHHIELSDVRVDRPPEAGDVEVAVVDASAQIGYNDAQRSIETLIAAARQRLALQTPYFNPSPAVVGLLVDALERGVEIDLVVPGPHIDNRISDFVARDIYQPVMAAGARVWRYQPSMMHTKVFLVDGALSVVGSVNINRRSVEKDEEVALAILDEETTRRLEGHLIADIGNSVPASQEDRSAATKLAGKLLKPFRKEM